MKGIYLFELKALISGLKAYIFTAIMILSSGIFITYWNLYNGLPNVEYSLSFITIPLMLCVPFLTFSAYSRDRETGADMTLFSLGVKPVTLMLGKYLAYLTVFTVSFLFIFIVPFILTAFADINIPGALAGLLGYYLYGAVLTALCLLVSSVTSKQLYSAAAAYTVVALTYLSEIILLYVEDSLLASFFLLSIIILLCSAAVYFLTRSETASIVFAAVLEVIVIILRFAAPEFFTEIFGNVMSIIALRNPMSGFLYGLFDLTCIAEYAVIIAALLIFTALSLLRRRHT